MTKVFRLHDASDKTAADPEKIGRKRLRERHDDGETCKYALNKIAFASDPLIWRKKTEKFEKQAEFDCEFAGFDL